MTLRVGWRLRWRWWVDDVRTGWRRQVRLWERHLDRERSWRT